ncbi:DUF4252 domain-containing protein [Gelidibacter mesophilus]|uniref:DUF4252 domain-containing protein n=1 Tax=Gelidibacter mesophilus TaxID=169050 RepID=UPI0004288330|nr:DUF4252 domain-containing protein [Gelidibacter mesophilus]
MISLVKNFIGMVLLVVTLNSCNQGPSLQSYYVDKQEQPNFLSVDVPLSMLNIDPEHLTQDQQDAYKSIQKLNLLAYRMKSENLIEYEAEMAKVNTILAHPKYEELMRGGNPEDGKFVIKILGKEDDVEEFILFGTIENKGFAIVRILGNDMSPDKIMTLASALDKANINESQLGQFTEFFK